MAETAGNLNQGLKLQVLTGARQVRGMQEQSQVVRRGRELCPRENSFPKFKIKQLKFSASQHVGLGRKICQFEDPRFKDSYLVSFKRVLF